jgi:uncharacterized protein (TIGR00661 family)
MKILYSVQATGNGHISRCMELLPYLQDFGEVDIFLSGANSSLSLDAPVRYRSKGLSLFYTCNGGLNYWQMIREFQPMQLKQQIRDLPVEKYDLILNDFEYITAAACARKRIPSISFGHQASFQSAYVPRPATRSKTGEWILKKYAPATAYVGLHFQPYDEFIFTPIIKKEIREAEPSDKSYVTVYLPSFCEWQLTEIFSVFKDFRFEIFSGQSNQKRRERNMEFIPVDKKAFNESLRNCSGIITSGGFETPAEALHLGKKIIIIPIRGHYEQLCNAEALEQMGILKLKNIGPDFKSQFESWINSRTRIHVDYRHSVERSLHYLLYLKKVISTKYEVQSA